MGGRKIKDLEDLNGVGPATAKWLRDAGYADLRTIALEKPAVLARAAGIDESTASKITRQAVGFAQLSVKDLQAVVAELQEALERQGERLVHLEELHRMQALPPFFTLQIVDYEGPRPLMVSNIEGEPRCMLCGRLINNGDWGFELETRRCEEFIEKIKKSRVALLHIGCYYEASRTSKS